LLAIAVLAEIAAYPYGQRNDKLSAEMIGSLSEQAGAAETKAQSAFEKSALAENEAENADTVAGNALTDSKIAKEETGKAKEAVNAVSKRAENVDNALTQTIEALRQPSLSLDDIKDLKTAFEKCPNRDTVVVRLNGVFTSNVAYPIFDALSKALFWHSTLETTQRLWQGISVHSSMEDRFVALCISDALSKKLPILGITGFSDTAGVTIDVGEQPMGALPK
jgi:hypothetical protein